MGDVNAAEWCAEAHTKVLRAAGSYGLHVTLANGRPPPRGPIFEAVVIDDHFGCAVDPPGSTANADILDQSFRAAGAGYDAAGLARNTKKARRRARSGVYLGAEFVAGSTLLGAERVRRKHLCEASLALIAAGRTTRAFLRRLMGRWTHVCMFRRPLMSVMTASFIFLGPVTDAEHTVVMLPRSVAMELKRLSILGASAVFDLSGAQSCSPLTRRTSAWVSLPLWCRPRLCVSCGGTVSGEERTSSFTRSGSAV